MNTGIGGGRPPSEEWLRFRDWLVRLGTEISLAGSSGSRPCNRVSGGGRGGLPAHPGRYPESKAGVTRLPWARPDLPRPPRTCPCI